MKTCSTCKIEKQVSEFYKNKQGLEYQCKLCKKEYQQFHKTERAEYDRAYCQTSAGKKAHKRSKAKSIQKYPEKIKAKSAVNNAIALGKLQRSVFCEHCGLPTKTEGHHSDYNKLLDVEWLCRECHNDLHRKGLVCQES